MGTVVVTALGILMTIGLVVGGRHLYLRLDRPGGFECSLRIVSGDVPGLGAKFRAGYAGPEVARLYWRRIARPGARVRFPLDAVRINEGRRPRMGERLAIPATFTIIPVEIDDDTTLELALPSRHVKRLIALLAKL